MNQNNYHEEDKGTGCFMWICISLLIASLVYLVCGCGGVPRLITLQVDTKPAAEIYFDGFYMGTGAADFQVFSNLIPNYLEIRDIITGDLLTRLILHDIPDLERILLEYGDHDSREERIQDLMDYLIKTGRVSNSLNGQNPENAGTDPAGPGTD